MTFIYDIILNWCKDKIYDFYEWESSDKIDHIKRIPLFKVKEKVINDIINYNVVIDEIFNKKIYNMTEVYKLSTTSKIQYAFLITDGISVLGLMTDKSGYVRYKSKLLIDEEEEIICISCKLNITDFNYIIKEKINNDEYFTRNELKVKKYLLKELERIYKENDADQLRYLYAEYFEKSESDIELIYNELKESLKTEVTDEHINLYNLLQLIGSCS